MTADEEVENNAPNCKKPKLNDDPFADMRDGGAASMVAHSTDEPTAEDKLAKYKALRLPPTSRKNPLLFWRENASEFSLMSATARRIYSISASSAQSERDFSSLGHTITDVRSMLSAGRVEAIEIVRSAISTGLADTTP
jgi:hypothetical protein